MRRTLSLLIAALCVACTTGTTDESTTTTTAGQPTTTATVVADPVVLRYGHAPGDTLTYDVDVNQDITFSADGDAPSFGEDELPIDADLVTESASTLTMSFSEGPQDDTVALHVVGTFSGTRVAGTVNGESVDSLEEGGVEADLARIDPVDAMWVLNPRGEVIDTSTDPAGMVGAELAALTGVTDDLLSTPLGPVFPVERSLVLGDVWESASVRRTRNGSVDALSTSEVTDVTEGVVEITTTTVTDGYETDLADGFRELFLELEEVSADGDLPPEIQQQLDDIQFTISVAEATSVSIVEFDVDRGIVLRATRTTGVRLTMAFRFPNAPDGNLSGYDLDLDLTQSAVYELAS